MGISGGGSALLPSPIDGITLDEKVNCIKTVAKAGASIQQLNTVRTHLSVLKGGGLARSASPASVISLIFSDVMGPEGSNLEFIASGPTCQQLSTTPRDALQIIRSFGLESLLPSSIIQSLQQRETGIHHGRSIQPPTEEATDVNNVLIGSNREALKAAEQYANLHRPDPCQTLIMKDDLCGDVEIVADHLTQLIIQIAQQQQQQRPMHETEIRLYTDDARSRLNEIMMSPPNKTGMPMELCLIWGGECTVNVRGNGLGGRNQELVLRVLIQLAESPDLSVDRLELTSAGTDGQDGPTDAAGATIDQRHVQMLKRDPVLMANALQRLNSNDSYAFWTEYDGGSCHLKTGMTGTNVADILILRIVNQQKTE